MLRLVIFRHAKAERAQHGQADRTRELTEDGRTAAARMAVWLAGTGIAPDLVLCSPAARTRQTWQLAAPAFPGAKVRFEPGLYEASARQVLKTIHGMPQNVHTLLVIGHNPSLEDLAALLLAPHHAKDGLHLPTGAIAILTSEVRDWAGLRKGAAALAELMTPKHLGVGSE
jgi:phosphohistidine phosphatase